MRKTTILLALLVFVLIAGCTMQTTVKDINADPAGFMDRQVRLEGKVMIPMDLGGAKGFTLRDNGASIMVASDNVPKSGAEVVVNGRVARGIMQSPIISAHDVIEK